MCGLAGIFVYRNESNSLVDREELIRIRDHMFARGPDGAGLWISSDRRIGLAHRRLAVIDLSPAGSQPMSSADGDLVVVFNGEIYNYRELRVELEKAGHQFRSNSDTECLLHAYREWREDMVDRLRGMYAFAIWQESTRSLFLVRDPFGIKPLYFADDGKTIRFASQVKALMAGGAIPTARCAAGRAGFFLLGSVPEPFTTYRAIRSLPAGAFLIVCEGEKPASGKHFDLRMAICEAEDGVRNRPHGVVRDSLSLDFRESIEAHLVSDVPIGVFLSSGVDSASILGVAAEIGTRGLKAFTLGFSEFSETIHDETPGAKLIARGLNVPHHVAWVTENDFGENLERILSAMDQPSIDGVNTFFVSRIAADGDCKVVLSGLGGDEFSGGYPHFRDIPRLASSFALFRHMPFFGRMVRWLMAPMAKRFGSPKHASLFEYGGTIASAYLLRRSLFLPWELPLVMDGDEARDGLAELSILERLDDSICDIKGIFAQIMCLDVGWYMKNQLLRDSDWAGMAHSLEIRTPFVDRTLFDRLLSSIAFGFPPTKSDIAMAPQCPVSESVVGRTKTGFTIPVRQWMMRGHDVPVANVDRGLRSYARFVALSQG